MIKNPLEDFVQDIDISGLHILAVSGELVIMEEE